MTGICQTPTSPVGDLGDLCSADSVHARQVAAVGASSSCGLQLSCSPLARCANALGASTGWPLHDIKLGTHPCSEPVPCHLSPRHRTACTGGGRRHSESFEVQIFGSDNHDLVECLGRCLCKGKRWPILVMRSYPSFRQPGRGRATRSGPVWS